MTQDLRHNMEAGSSLHITYLGFSPVYKRAFRGPWMLISNFPLYVRSGGAEEQGPAGVQVGTGEDQVSTANLFTL
jgi:hypothetical protein